VTEYYIQIKTSTGAYLPSVSCNGVTSVASRSCSVPYVELRTTFGLALQDSIVFQVKAKNVIDWGVFSLDNSVTDVVRSPPLAPPTQVSEGALTSDS
jgi:hypothetical protein